jgi:hypothetical protein
MTFFLLGAGPADGRCTDKALSLPLLGHSAPMPLLFVGASEACRVPLGTGKRTRT